MSVKEVTVNQCICDWCGKPMPPEEEDESEGAPYVIIVPLPTQASPDDTVEVRVDCGEFDLHERCQYLAIAEAARRAGTRKPRGRAAKGAMSSPSDPTSPTPDEAKAVSGE